MGEVIWELFTGNNTTNWNNRTQLSLQKIKPYELCHSLYNSPSYNCCVSWSEDNFIAFTSVDGGHNNTHNNATQTTHTTNTNANTYTNNIQHHPIHIARPDHLSSHITLKSSHTSPIKILEWSPVNCGQFLLSADTSDRVCLWKMRENIDDWICVSTYRFENVIATKWLNTDRKVYALSGGEQRQSPLASIFAPFNSNTTRRGLQIPPGMPVVMLVSALMGVTLVFQRFIEGIWGFLSCTLSVAPPLPLACADIHVASSGQIFIAVAGPHLGNTIAVYEVTLDLFASTITSHLKSRVELGVNKLNPVAPAALLSPIRAIPTVTHLAFDPSADGLALLVVSAGLGPRDIVQLERWQYKPVPIQREKILPPSLLPLTMPNQHLIDLWVTTESVDLDISKSMEPMPYVTPLHPDFVTTIRCTISGTLWIGYLCGRIEVRDCKTLVLREDKENSYSSTTVPINEDALYETITTFSFVPPIPVAIGSSPNNAVVCALYYDGRLRSIAGICENDYGNEQSYARKLADMLEVSMARGTDPWDVLALLQSGGAGLCYLTLLNIGKDLSNLPEAQRWFFVHKWEALRSSLYSIAGHHVASMECQARSFMYFVLDTIRSNLVQVLSASSSFAKNWDEPPAVQPATHETAAIVCLVPFVDWLVDFTAFFLKCISLFVKTRNQEYYPEQSPIVIPEGYAGRDLSLCFPFYSRHIGGQLQQTPFVCFLFEPTTLRMLVDLLLLGGMIISLNSNLPPTTGSKLPKHELREIKRNHDMVSVVAKSVLDIVTTNDEKPNFGHILKALRDQLAPGFLDMPQQDIMQIHNDARLLDLGVDMAQSFTKNSGVAGPTITTNYDVLTRQPLTDKQYRKCIRCHRTSSLIKASPVPWKERWCAACPICGGKWTVPEQ